jgi:hypothetical protein
MLNYRVVKFFGRLKSAYWLNFLNLFYIVFKTKMKHILEIRLTNQLITVYRRAQT